MKQRAPRTLLDVFDPEFVQELKDRQINGNSFEEEFRILGFVFDKDNNIFRLYHQKDRKHTGMYLPDGTPNRVPVIETFPSLIKEFLNGIFPARYDEMAEDLNGLGTTEKLSAKEMLYDLRQGYVDVQGKQTAYRADESFMPHDHLMMYDRHGRPFFFDAAAAIPQRIHKMNASRESLTDDDLEFLSSDQAVCRSSDGHIENKVITPLGYCAFLLPK